MNWLSASPEGCVVTVKATPRANTSEITGCYPEWVRVRLQAPPVDGKANAALIALFAKQFNIPKRAVEILSGDTSRLKRVRLRGVSAETAVAALTA